MYLLYGTGFGYGWNGVPMNDPAYLPFARLTTEELDRETLPKEVQEALLARKDEAFSAADTREGADGPMPRR